MAALPQSGAAPVLIVDTPAAVQGVKHALAQTGWPGREQGAPLPWCGSLAQAFAQLADRALALGIANAPPRPDALRRVQLAQLLLDHAALSVSLGGSAKAALDLAAQWVDIFQGWEWLEVAGNRFAPQAGGTAFQADITTLAALAQQNRQPDDHADWAATHAPRMPDFGNVPVVFCLGRTPAPLDIAVAKTLWGASDDQLQVLLPQLPDQDPRAIAQGAAFIIPTAPRLRIAAHSVEEAAWSAAQTIMQWRAQGMDDIGVVPLDRKIVRRLRALLDRAGEPLNDRSGWSLDTAVAASAVTGISELLTHRATTQSLLEWIHSPFVAAALRDQFGFGFQERQTVDAALRGFGRIAPVQLKMLLDQHLLPAAFAPMAHLPSDQRLSVNDWVSRLLQALEQCGLQALLAEDAAGQAIVAALQQLQAQSGANPALVSVTLWQAVLAERLSESRFSEPTTESAVRVCAMDSLAWRPPQGLLLVGADATRLPQRPTPRFFEPNRLAEMGLQLLPEIAEAERFAQFASIWAAPFPMTLIACSDKPDSEVEFSGWIELLSLTRHDLIEQQSATEFLSQRSIHLAPYSAPPSLQAVWPHPLPPTLTVSALQSLADCSYQFYLQTLLGFAPMTELQEEAAPSDLGSLLHLALKKATVPRANAEEWQEWLEQEIDRVLRTPFFQKRHDHGVRLPIPAAMAASLRAQALAVVPELARWLLSRAAAGSACNHSLITTEHPVERELTPVGITIKGRIDRIEQTEAGLHLIDFKTTEAGDLKRRVKTVGEDVQLPLYAWLMAQAVPVAQNDRAVQNDQAAQTKSATPAPTVLSAAYVSVRREAVKEVAVAADTPQALAEHTQATLELLAHKLLSIQKGEPIWAEGIQKDKKICERCRVRGICRRDDLLIASEMMASEQTEGSDE
jgi:ATP-dependent helicase/nuclease subunit B